MLVKCNLRAALIALQQADDTHGKAADTGSAIHKAVSVWHGSKHDYTGHDNAAALAAMRKEVSDYPLADLDEAERQFRAYSADPRNQTAEVVCNETKVSFTFGPPETRVTVSGTLDQVRREFGRLYVWDIKTGQDDGLTMLAEYATQLTAYCVGATLLLGTPVFPGGIVRTRGYFVRNKPRPAPDPDYVFFHAAWGPQDYETILRPVVQAVALIRAGNLSPRSGAHCLNKCPYRGLDGCLPALRTLLENV